MITQALLLVLILATLARIFRTLRLRSGGPVRPRSNFLAWTASPVLHAALGVLAASISLGRPLQEGLLPRANRPEGRPLSEPPVAVLVPDLGPQVSGERVPDSPVFEHPLREKPERAVPEPPGTTTRPEAAEVSSRPPDPRTPAHPRALDDDRFVPLSPASTGKRSPLELDPSPPRIQGDAAGRSLGEKDRLRGFLAPGSPAAILRGGIRPLAGLPRSAAHASPRTPGPARVERVRPSGLVPTWVRAAPLRPTPGLPSVRVGLVVLGGIPGRLASTSGAPLGTPTGRRPVAGMAGIFPEGRAPGRLQLAAGPAPTPDLRKTPSAVTGTDLRKPGSELNGTTLRPLPAGLNGTDLKGRR
jgi:hypothetical protein